MPLDSWITLVNIIFAVTCLVALNKCCICMSCTINVLLIPGSAVRLPYHQPEKKDLSVFLARTELKQQKFVGTSRLSWKQFVPPASSLTKVDSNLSAADAVSSEKVSSALPAKSSTASDVDGAVGQSVLECDELPDLLSFCSKSKTVPVDSSVSCAEVTVSQVQTSPRSSPQKLLLLSPVKNATPAVSEPSALSQSSTPRDGDLEQVETSLTPAVVKKLVLDPVDKKNSGPLQSAETDPAASDAGEMASNMSSLMDSVAVSQQDADDDVVAKIPPSSTAAKISSRSSHRVLPSDVPLPQLSGNPNDFIELDDNDDDGNYRQENAGEQGVERLMERVLRHARGSAQTRKPKTVEIR